MKTLDHERLFEPFLDVIDGVLCLDAASRSGDIAANAAEHGLRFPLILDNEAPLSEQVQASGFAPASSRFGPYCDNITGMNWELPDGRRVRLGERVVKSTTGYDLFRFLLGTDGRFGRPLDLVLRLRPACDGGAVYFLHGAPPDLEQAVAAMLQSCYLHWFESVDWLCSGDEDSDRVRVGVHCPTAEQALFFDELSRLANRHGLSLRVEAGDGRVVDGLPDLVLKTTPDNVVPMARRISNENRVQTIGLCYNGVVHVYLPSPDDALSRIQFLVAPIEARLHEDGGDWQSRHLAKTIHGPQEAAWVNKLAERWGIET
ncbi:MAG: FAD-binding oxidoreductase [Proteobacteria bacterium]|nr:FAD-binding oxidoreductase [Pseudomonadota bacterium]